MSKSLFEQAKGAKSAEELMSLAKTVGVDMGEENAKQLFGRLHQSGELSDDELNNVAGGGCKSKEEEVDVYAGRRFQMNSWYKGMKCSCGGTTFIVESSGPFGFGTDRIILDARCEQCGGVTNWVFLDMVVFID